MSKEISGMFISFFIIIFFKDPGVFLLGLPSSELHLLVAHYRFLEKLLLIARKCISLNWIKGSSVTIGNWEIFNALPHERLQATIKTHDKLFLRVWSLCLHYPPSGFKYLLLEYSVISQNL